MDVEAGTSSEPALDGRRLVRRVVVEDQVDIEIGGYGLVDLLEEAPELETSMSPVALAQVLASIRRFCQYTLETQGKDWRTSDSGH